MVKFKLPGNDRTKFNIGGHFYSGGVVYDNKLCNIPENELHPSWIIM